jgi:hypothetical protein
VDILSNPFVPGRQILKNPARKRLYHSHAYARGIHQAPLLHQYHRIHHWVAVTPTRLDLVSENEKVPIVPDSFFGRICQCTTSAISLLGFSSPEVIVACLSTLTRLKSLVIKSQLPRSGPNRRPPPSFPDCDWQGYTRHHRCCIQCNLFAVMWE